MDKRNVYDGYARRHSMPETVSLEEIEEKIEQSAREEESDSIVLAEDKRVGD